MSEAAVAPYSVHDGEAVRDRAAMLAIWQGNLGHDTRMASKYDWFYLRSPHGSPLLKLLRHDGDGDWAGACTLGQRRMQMQGREIRAGLLVDFAVRAGHRSLGPALVLQQSLLASAQSRFDLVYGFPNAKARAIFKRLGWTNLVDMVRYTRVLRHETYLRRRLPALLATPLGLLLDTAQRLRDGLLHGFRQRCHAAWSTQVDPRMDALWASSPRDDALATVRDVAYLRWRFDDCPLASTRYLLLSARTNDQLIAWFATQVEGNTLHVRDCWSADGTRGMAASHVEALLQAARKAGHAAVSIEIGTDESRIAGWRSRGFIAREGRPVYGARTGMGALGGGKSITPYFTAADEDE